MVSVAIGEAGVQHTGTWGVAEGKLDWLHGPEIYCQPLGRCVPAGTVAVEHCRGRAGEICVAVGVAHRPQSGRVRRRPEGRMVRAGCNHARPLVALYPP